MNLKGQVLHSHDLGKIPLCISSVHVCLESSKEKQLW